MAFSFATVVEGRAIKSRDLYSDGDGDGEEGRKPERKPMFCVVTGRSWAQRWWKLREELETPAESRTQRRAKQGCSVTVGAFSARVSSDGCCTGPFFITSASVFEGCGSAGVCGGGGRKALRCSVRLPWKRASPRGPWRTCAEASSIILWKRAQTARTEIRNVR